MSRSFLVDRTGLGLAPLQLWDPPRFVVPEGGFIFGTPADRRTTVESPIVDGTYQTAAVRGHQMSTVSVHVAADTGALLGAAVTELVQAFSQFTYRLDWNLDGLIGAWRCDRAWPVFGPGGTPDEFWLSFFQQPVTFQIPRHPIPLLGSI